MSPAMRMVISILTLLAFSTIMSEQEKQSHDATRRVII